MPLFIGQSAGWSSWPSACGYPTTNCLRVGTPAVPLGLNLLFKNHYSDGLITVVGPQYQYNFADNPHMISSQRTGRTEMGYREYGAKMAQAAYNVTRKRTGWKPVYPQTITTVSATVTLTFYAATQLVLDTTTISDRVNCGFDVIDSGDAATAIAGSGATCANAKIAGNVVVSGTNAIVLTLNQAPVGTLEVLYAYTPVGTNCPGYGVAPCSTGGGGGFGNLRDSDPTRCWCNPAPDMQTVFLYNFALMFRETTGLNLSLSEPDLSGIPGQPEIGSGSLGGASSLGGNATIN